MNLIQVVLGVSGYHQARAFNHSCKYPRQTQETLLKRILEVNAGTAFGKDYGFSSTRSIEEFQKKVPISSYNDLEPYIKRAARGEPRQLTVDPPILFATTSGTTGVPKYIPITKTSRRDKSTAMRLWLYHSAMEHPKMFDGNILGVVSPEVEGMTECGLPYGAESGHCYRNMPKIMRGVYAIPYDAFTLKDYEAKYYTMLRIAAGKNITVIGTCNPSTILLLAQKLAQYQEPIIRDIRDGTLRPDLDIPGEIREQFEASFSPDPDRAAYLETCMLRENVLLPKDAWPNLALIGCWKGGSVGLYLREFGKLFDPKTPIRDWGYLASEVRGSIPLWDEGCGGALTIETNFFEFVREQEIDWQSRNYLMADELEDGQQYYVFPTTTGGLYRYEMNDLVLVNGFHEGTPIIEFIQKGKGVSSLTGEKLYETHVCAAVGKCAGVIPEGFEFIVSTPEWSESPRYVFLVEEIHKQVPDTQWRNWIGMIDKCLCKENEEYEVKRKSLRLASAVVKVVARGELQRYRQERVAEGAPDGQFKMLKLNPDLEFQKEFLVERVIETED